MSECSGRVRGSIGGIRPADSLLHHSGPNSAAADLTPWSVENTLATAVAVPVPIEASACPEVWLETGMSVPEPTIFVPGDRRPLARLVRSRGFAWGISLGLHGALFLSFYHMGFVRAADPRRVIIPDARLAAGTPAALPGPDVPIKLAEAPVAVSTGMHAPRLDDLQIVSVEASDPSTAEVNASGQSAIALPGLELTGTAAATGGSGGGGGAVGPVSRFFGVAGNAYKVVYVADVSASLMIRTDEIADEMQNSIRSLLPSQQFHIILAMGHQIREMPPQRLVPANTAYKDMAADMIQLVRGKIEAGEADPIEAMRRAFAVRPELIYFLTDGAYQKVQDDLEAMLKRWNAHGETRITVVAFDPFPATRPFLERLARDHGGHCRFVGPK